MEIRERISVAHNIAIFISPVATISEIQIAHTIACALKKLGKRVQIATQVPSSGTKNIFSVTLKGVAPRVAQVSYEKDQNDLKLHFALQKGNISPENISLDITPQTDLTIIVGDKKAEYNYQQIHTLTLELLLNHQEVDFRLLGALLLKLQHTAPQNVYTATLTQKDFQDALAKPEQTAPLIENLRVQFGSRSSYLLFLEKPSGEFQALLWSTRRNIFSDITQQAPLQTKGNWTLWTVVAAQKHLIHKKLLLS